MTSPSQTPSPSPLESQPTQGSAPTSDTPTRVSTPSQSSPSPASPTSRNVLTESLRIHSIRLRRASVRAEFEHSLITLLTLYVIYTYYIDHMLLVLIIRASQVIRLLYFPYATAAAQHGTVLLLLVSNIPVLILHHVNFSYSKEPPVGDMLFINFIGPEPRGFAKIVTVDSIIVILEALLLQCKWPSLTFRLLSVLPLPASEQLPSSSNEQSHSQGAESQETEHMSGTSRDHPAGDMDGCPLDDDVNTHNNITAAAENSTRTDHISNDDDYNNGNSTNSSSGRIHTHSHSIRGREEIV